MSPRIAVAQFAVALCAGILWGLWDDFLLPLYHRKPILAQLLMGGALVHITLRLGLEICGGDLRLACFGGIPLGFFLWHLLPRRSLLPLWQAFWELVFRFFTFLFYPAVKISAFCIKFTKKLLAIAKKRSTIEDKKKTKGGASHGKAHQNRQASGDFHQKLPYAENRRGVHLGGLHRSGAVSAYQHCESAKAQR